MFDNDRTKATDWIFLWSRKRKLEMPVFREAIGICPGQALR
jgi:hypothetical protein